MKIGPNSVETLRALKRLGIDPNNTSRVILDLREDEPPTIYVQSTSDDAHELLLSLEDGDFQIFWQAKGDGVEKTAIDPT